MTALSRCRQIELPTIPNPDGSLAVIEADGGPLPFPIRRVYYLHSVPEGAKRGGHAHRRLEQMLVAVSGRLRVLLDDGAERRSEELSDPTVGLYLPTMVWRELVDFDAGTVCLVIASRPYEPEDYIRDYDEFVAASES